MCERPVVTALATLLECCSPNWFSSGLPMRIFGMAAGSVLLGAGVSASVTPETAIAAKPRVQDDQADGAANSPLGEPQVAGLLRGYAARPPWKVAGVDYYVGLPAGTYLKDPLTTAADGWAVDTTNHQIRVKANNVRLDGYDFSLHGGYGIYILAGIRGTVVVNSKFLVGTNNVVPIVAEADAGDLTIKYNTIDGGSLTANGNSNSVWALISFNGSGNFVAQYNFMTNAPSDAIDFSNGTIKPTIEYKSRHEPGSRTGVASRFCPIRWLYCQRFRHCLQHGLSTSRRRGGRRDGGNSDFCIPRGACLSARRDDRCVQHNCRHGTRPHDVLLDCDPGGQRKCDRRRRGPR